MEFTINLKKWFIWTVLLITIITLTYAEVNHYVSEVSGIEEHFNKIQVKGISPSEECKLISVGEKVNTPLDWGGIRAFMDDGGQYSKETSAFCGTNQVPIKFYVEDTESVVETFMVKCCQLQIEYEYKDLIGQKIIIKSK
tara:strand:+ start:59 stop:478 length:420 start_codon:yes stop_codon:yes gene_type:complete